MRKTTTRISRFQLRARRGRVFQTLPCAKARGVAPTRRRAGGAAAGALNLLLLAASINRRSLCTIDVYAVERHAPLRTRAGDGDRVQRGARRGRLVFEQRTEWIGGGAAASNRLHHLQWSTSRRRRPGTWTMRTWSASSSSSSMNALQARTSSRSAFFGESRSHARRPSSRSPAPDWTFER